MNRKDTEQNTILIIDDTPQNLGALISFLEESGFRISVAQRGEEALKRVERILPDMILLDVLMPGMDGFETCRHLKELDATRELPVIFMTALSETVEKVKGFDAGGVDYITKPVQHEEVLARINTHLTIRKLQQQLQVQNDRLQENNVQLQLEIFGRIQAEESLKLSEERYRRLVEQSPEAIVVHQDGRIMYVNPVGVTLFSADNPEELIGKSIFDCVHPDYHPIVKERIRTIYEEGELADLIEEKFVRLDGQEVNVEVAGAPITYQGKPAIQLVIRDITERKRVEEELEQYHKHLYKLVEERTVKLTQSNQQLHQEISDRKKAEKALRKSEQQYRALAEHVADGIAIFQEGKFVFVNDALASIVRYTPDQLLHIEPIDLLREDYKEQSREKIELIEKGASELYWQIPCMTGDGREIWVEARRSRIEWEGQPATLVTVRDITESKLRELTMEKEKAHLERENITLRSTIKDRYKFGEIIGRSPAMQDVYQSIVNASASDTNVLIYGESGTGKELVAQTIHQLSERKERNFVPVNCGAVPEPLFESEFFGHRKGAFTGATLDKLGYFDRAHKGTLFLDEIGELNTTMQVKLLRVLQDGEYTPLGDSISKKADVRIIAATNKDLKEQLREGLIREDFFYRIRVITINLPPLRKRKEDIPLLIEHFLEQCAGRKDRTTIPARIIELLCAYHWPGNVRELQNELQRYLAEQRLEFIGNVQEAASDLEFNPEGLSFREAVEAFEKRFIARALHQHSGHQGKTAAMLSIPPRTLYTKIKKYRLKNPMD